MTLGLEDMAYEHRMKELWIFALKKQRGTAGLIVIYYRCF